MQLYRYRWLVSLAWMLLIVVLGYTVDVRDRLNDYAQLMTRETHIKKQLALQQKRVIVSHHTEISASDVYGDSIKIRALLKLISESNVDVVSLVNSGDGEAEGGESESCQFVLNADYSHLIRLLQKMATVSDKFQIGNFEIRGLKNNRVNFAIALSITNGSFEERPDLPVSQEIDNPFCESAEAGLIRATSALDVLRYPLNNLQLLGVVSYLNKRDAVLRFPDGLIKSFPVDARVGSGGGRITEIYSDKLVIQMPDHSRRIIVKNSLH